MRDAFEVAPDAAVVQAVSQAAAGVLGQAPALVGQTPWMDSALLAAAGVETVVIGPGGAGAAGEGVLDLQRPHDHVSCGRNWQSKPICRATKRPTRHNRRAAAS